MPVNPIELTYQPGRTVYCVRSSLLSGSSLFIYNTSTQLYEAYNSANWALYVVTITEVAPGLYRGTAPSGSLSIPATEYYYDQKGGSPDPTVDAPSIASGNSQGVNIGTINGTQQSLGSDVATDIAICNLALTHLGQAQITTLSDATENARRCNQIFNTIRDEVLSASAWSFAKVIDTLVELTAETVIGWAAVFTKPSNCLTILKVYGDDANHFDLPFFPDANNLVVPSTNPQPQEFDTVYQVDLDLEVIVTNFTPAYINYIARVTNSALYSKLFIKAFSFRLAAELAIILNGDQTTSDKMFAKYGALITEAQRMNGYQDGVKRLQKSTYIDSRG